jgi:glycosyltransferase involved in cell wall biosynthesis
LPLRILIDANPVIHGERAVRRNSRNLIEHLLKRNSGIEYILFYHDWRDNRESRISLVPHGIHREYVCRLPGRVYEWSWRHLSRPVVESFVSPIDLIYGTDLIFPPSRQAIAMSTLRGAVYLIAPELTPPGHADTLKRALHYALKESDYFLAVSNQTKQDFVKYLDLPQNRIFVSSHGVDPGMRRLDDRELVKRTLQDRFQLRNPYILNVGVLSHNKNIIRMIKAFMLITSENPDLMLVLAGPFENAHHDAVSLVKKTVLEHRVRFLGLLSPDGDDLLYLYNGAEVLLHPSLFEGWTAPPLEAMACGIPVVASNASSIPETCGNAAYFIDPLNIDSIAQGVRSVLLNADLRRSMIEKGYRRVKECQWSDSASRLEDIFNELILLGRWRK